METAIVTVIHLFIFFIGAAIGSFLNVVIYRIPAGKSLLYPPSQCPVCAHKLGWTENVPIVGWLRLGGRCLHCKTPISPRYPIVEAITGILFLSVYWHYGISLQAIAYAALLCWLLALSAIDLDTMTLPNSLTQSALVVGLGFQVAIAWQTTGSTAGVARGLAVGIGAAVLGIWGFDIITWLGSAALGQTAMGGGDAKLAAAIGAWLGIQLLVLSVFLACALGAFVGGGAIALGAIDRRQPMPFGPFLALGAALAIFAGEAIISTYMNLFFPLG